MSMEESISLEETNKIRISLGLKPLTEDKEPVNDKEKQAEDNYAKKREQEAKDRDAKKIADRIAKVRNRKELNASLRGATLGDADADVDDTLKWLKRSKKREKELAKKREEEMDNMDKVAQEEYTERDLVGLKVSHDFDEMDEGDARILTLKDSRILDNEEDELQNVEMAEEERIQKNKELKIKKRDYTGYDDEEFVEGAHGMMKRSVLAKYDEDIEGSRETGFRLGSSVISSKSRQAEEKQHAAAMVNKSLLSIDYTKNLETADYLKEGDVGFKKPKSKKKRPSRRVPAEVEDALADAMDVDQKPIVPRERNFDTNFVDDDELQAALTRSRKAKLHKTKKLTPEQLAKKIAEERAQEESAAREASVKAEEAADNEGEDGEGLVFDETSEFVRAVQLNPIVKPESIEPSLSKGDADSKARSLSIQPPTSRQRSESRDVSMAPGDVPMEELEAGEVRVKDEEDEDYNLEMLDAIEDVIQKVESGETPVDDITVGTSSEQSFASGMAATLNILRQQGILSQPTMDQKEREAIQRERDAWLAEQRRRVTQRELDRLQSRGGNKDQSQREYDNRLRDQQEARDTMESYKNYKPDVNIVYYDEFGRSLTPKEAWKALSHKFHGKGSGKMKTEKRLKKIAEEKKKEAMASGDTPLSMNRAFQMRQEKAGQAHMVLAVGNRGAVPQAPDFLETQPLAKGKTEKAKKKKEGKGVQQVMESGFMMVPAPQMQVLSNGASPVASGFSSTAGSPAPKPGFSRISSAVDTPSQSGTPVPGDRAKVTFGLGTKRKAADEAPGSPASKRR
ncbi:SART-1 family-domain-containing protein [Crucibulum laeve]|uniref:SART-1 family-domain-containing protein n=1 Tax=Crucibulum laeve TaxID=68775 RepID=A0A5C3M4X4_9AGAR|nr:SART-1 family-domain-containing protein [Crucibulum laeve]